MKKKVFRFLGGGILAFLFVYNVSFNSSNANSGEISIDILSSQALVCSSECTAYPECTIKIDCSEICVEFSNSFRCGDVDYYCGDYC